MDSPSQEKDWFLTQNVAQAQKSCASNLFKVNLYFIWDVRAKKKKNGLKIWDGF